MKVKELIALLENMDKEKGVNCPVDEERCAEVKSVIDRPAFVEILPTELRAEK